MDSGSPLLQRRVRRVLAATTGARHAAPSALILAALAMTACGGAASSAATAAPTATKAPTPYPLNGGAFTATIPPGWRDLTHNAASLANIGLTGTVYMLVQHDPPGTFVANRNDVNTDVYAMPITQGFVTAKDFAALLASTAKATGGQSVSAPVAITVGGEPGQAVTYTNQVQGTPAMHEVVLVNHGLNTYEFIVDSSQFAYGVLGGDAAAMLASLRWVG